MQKLSLLTLTCSLSILCLGGCKAAVQDTEETSTAVEVTSESTPTTTPNEATAANTTGGAKSPEFTSKSLDVVFVGGHLGQYADCPEEGQKPKKAALFSTAKPMAEKADCAGDCGRLNCDPGQVTLQLTNRGSEALTGVHLAPLGLVGDDKSVVAKLPVLSMVNTASNERFDGNLAPNASVTLRVDFSGPANIKDFVPSQERWGGKAPLEITVNVDGEAASTITSPPVEVPGMVVT